MIKIHLTVQVYMGVHIQLECTSFVVFWGEKENLPLQCGYKKLQNAARRNITPGSQKLLKNTADVGGS